MKMVSNLLGFLRRGYILLIVALIVLIKIISTLTQTPTADTGTKLTMRTQQVTGTKPASGTSCTTSSPSTGEYTVTPCFTSPTDKITVIGDQTVSVTANVVGPNTGISKLIFYLNGQYLITVFQSPYTFVLPTNEWVDGNQALSVAVTMKDGFTSQPSSITLSFKNGVSSLSVNNKTFTPTSGTTPQPGQPFVLAATGDGAAGSPEAGNVNNLIASWIPNLFLYLGDVYESGSITEFYNWYGNSTTFFGRFRSITDPIVGNHEYLLGNASGYFDYWNNIPSYYSFDAAGWHFIALNSNCSLLKICAAGQAEYQWLQNDLNTHTNICTIAYYHHPVFNVGSERNATAMKDIWALMAQHSVDIVLNGHDHDYQRWVPLDGNGVSSPSGITEFIAGGGGHGTQQFIATDNRMAIGFTASPSTFGALRLLLNQYSANYQYINYLGTVLDSGTIPCSGAPLGETTPNSPSNLNATSSPSNVRLTWNASTGNVGVTGYDIYRNGSLLTGVGPVTSYSDTNVTLGATYKYQIKARDAATNTSGFSNTASVTISSLLFNDGFESGNLTSWTSSTNLMVQQKDVYSGAYAARASSSGSSTSYASESLSTPQSDLHFNLWFKVLSQGNTSAYLQRFRTSTNGAIVGMFVSSSGKLAYHDDAASSTTTSTIVVSQNIWHQLQTYLKINGTSSQIEAWYDGTKVNALSKTDNFGTDPIGRIYIGDNQPSHIYNIAFDEIGINTGFIEPSGTTTAQSQANTSAVTNTPNAMRTTIPTSTPGSSSISGAIAIQHVFVVVMENHSYDQVWNTSSSPYITSLGNTYARATNYHASIHPSLPNYLDLYDGSNYGITTDCDPSSSCHVSAVNLADNLEAKGLTWKGYMESMPSPCFLTTSGNYAPKHNPFVYFDDIRNNAARCASHDVPYTDLAADLASAATTPNFAFITPNLCNDMHNCSVATGDGWLKSNLPGILNSPACTVDKCLLILTWDEDDNGPSNQVLTIFAGSAAKTRGVTSAVTYSHFSTLRTVENIFGLPTQTSNDAAASPMTDLLR